ncbi:hypothetical protein H6G76_03195 [Nostoc sp. FACHB-152]|nr:MULTISPECIES: hypothetical protein [unclassified Nostoc]MBD2446178.1 hypothetical protein [Nostoc sp. FACHB-152]MBD2467410.1 hypothetical protein [Nostoc sp. FACHB-145]
MKIRCVGRNSESDRIFPEATPYLVQHRSLGACKPRNYRGDRQNLSLVMW